MYYGFLKFSILLLANSFINLPKLINAQLCAWVQFVFKGLFGVIYLSYVSAKVQKYTYFDDAVIAFTGKEESTTVWSLFH